MIKQIGTKIYYCLFTGNVIKIIGDMQGYVKETSFEEDYEIYTELKERDKETIDLIQFEYGEYYKLSENSTGVRVNLETKELEFTYEELPPVSQEPTEIEKIQNKISILEAENADLLLDSAIKDSKIQTLENDLADLTLEIAMMGGR